MPLETQTPQNPGEQTSPNPSSLEQVEKPSLDGLFVVAEAEKQKAETSSAETVQVQAEEARVEEEKRVTEKTRLEKAADYAFNSGGVHYKEIADPTGYANDAKKNWSDFVKKSRRQQFANEPFDTLSHPGLLYESTNRIREGRLGNYFPEVLGWTPIAVPRGAQDYLPNMSRSIREAVRKSVEGDEQWISALKRGMRIAPGGFGGGEYRDPNLTPEKIAEEVAAEETHKAAKLKQAELDIKKHAEGFGLAALEHGDLAVAIENLDAAGVLDDAAVVTKIQKQLKELQTSTDLSDKLKLRKVSEALLQVKARRESTAQQY